MKRQQESTSSSRAPLCTVKRGQTKKLKEATKMGGEPTGSSIVSRKGVEMVPK